MNAWEKATLQDRLPAVFAAWSILLHTRIVN
jgi:hypothetical protein